jgi:hypothetical protein
MRHALLNYALKLATKLRIFPLFVLARKVLMVAVGLQRRLRLNMLFVLKGDVLRHLLRELG